MAEFTASDITSTSLTTNVVNLSSGSIPTVTGTLIELYTTGGIGIANSSGSTELLTTSLTAARTYTPPDFTGTLVCDATPQTLTNKTIAGVGVTVLNTITMSGTAAAGYALIATSGTAASWGISPSSRAVSNVVFYLGSSSTLFTTISGYIVYLGSSRPLVAVYADIVCPVANTANVRLFNPSANQTIASGSATSASRLVTLTTPANLPAGVTLLVWQVQRASGSGTITTNSITLIY